MRNFNVYSTNSLNNIQILLGDFNAKVDIKHILKPKIRSEILHEIGNDNVSVVYFATSKNVIVRTSS
jgi:hypothetical protein